MSKKCTPLWREAHFQVKMYKTPQRRTTFGSCDVEKVHAVVARSTFPSQNVQNTSASDHFWKLRCRKSARRCGAKHISKSKCTKHTILGPLLEVATSKKCTQKKKAFMSSYATQQKRKHLNLQLARIATNATICFFCPNDACCLTVTGDSATWLHPLPALTSAAYSDAPRSTHAHLRFAGSACAGPHRDATVSHPHNTDAHSATAAPSQGGSLLLESPPHHEA